VLRFVSTVAIAGTLCAVLPMVSAAAADSVGTEIRLPAPLVAAPPSADLSDLPKSKSVAYLAVGTGVTQALADSVTSGRPMGFDVASGVHVSAAGSWSSTMTDGTRTWIGNSKDGQGSGDDVVLVLRPTGLGTVALSAGSVWHNGHEFALAAVAAGVVGVADVADDAYTTLDAHIAKPDGDATATGDPAPMSVVDPLASPPEQYTVDGNAVADSSDEAAMGSTAYVDVAALYTPAAAARVSDIVSKIAQYIAVANQANSNDGLSWRFRLVRVQQYSYTEQRDFGSDDLNKFRAAPAVQSLRATYGADLVALVGTGYSTTNQRDITPTGGICGYGYQNDGWGANERTFGYSLWEADPACAPTVAAHELGHNLTLRHDWPNDANHGAGSPYSPAYNHGYVSIPGDFNTVMGYSTSACPGRSCTPIPYWSNPNQSYGGFARGMAESTPTPAYDAKALAASGPQIAQWFTLTNPTGHLDSVRAYPNGVKVTGWALDPDTRGAIQVQALVDGVSVKQATANVARGDVDRAYPGFGPNHGFSFGAPATGGTHTICVRALNVSYGTANTQLPDCVSYTVPVDPVGAITGVARIPGGARITGWALDPDSAGAIGVHVSVDGVTQGTGTANAGTPDAPSTWADWGGSHGFSVGVSMTSAVAHTVCVAGMNVDEGVNVNVDCQSVTLSADPVGNIRAAYREPEGFRVEGWAIDPDTANPTEVAVYVDGVLRANHQSASYSGGSAAYPEYGPDHSYNVGILGPFSVGNHSVCVTALNIGNGANTSLGCRTVYYGHNPLGDFSVVRTAGNVVQVTGWAYDPDSAAQIDVQVTYAGVAGPRTSANQTTYALDADTASSYGNVHGFDVTGAVGVVGQQQVCVTAFNVGSGSDVSLGCKVVV
jgi:hypothetical protein